MNVSINRHVCLRIHFINNVIDILFIIYIIIYISFMTLLLYYIYVLLAFPINQCIKIQFKYVNNI